MTINLSVIQEQCNWRLNYRDSLFDDLFAKRVTVDHVIRQYQEVNNLFRPSMEPLRSMYPNEDDRCLAAIQLKGLLHGRRAADPAYPPLEGEVTEMIQREFPNSTFPEVVKAVSYSVPIPRTR